ncbi:MAG TPA: hypothetical protein DD412_06745 [Holosporales bacterium]|nr:hypothetical protein [Holosporales bacterium]
MNKLSILLLALVSFGIIMPSNANENSEKIATLLGPLLTESCNMSVPLKQKVTWSHDKLVNNLREAFSEKELDQIISYHEEMGGEEFVGKIVFLTSKMTQMMESLEVPVYEKIAISHEHSSLLDEEMKKKKIGVLLGSAYMEAFMPDINDSIFKKATKFKNKASLYLKSIAAAQYTLTEQRKIMAFEGSSLGKHLSEVVGKSFTVAPIPT